MKDKKQIEITGDNHISTNIKTPLRADAFDKSDYEKIENIQYHFKMIMEEMGLDLTDDSLSGTPYRFAKMYVKELFYGLNPVNKPKLSTFKQPSTSTWPFDKDNILKPSVVAITCDLIEKMNQFNLIETV